MIHKTSWLRKVNLAVFILFYVGAGINHFWHPQGYIDLIPPYFPAHPFINILSGILEIAGGILMMIARTRKFAAILVIGLLIAFIPAHIYLVQMHGCVSPHLCVAEWIAWVRFPIQALLIWWAWKTYKWMRGVK